MAARLPEGQVPPDRQAHARRFHPPPACQQPSSTTCATHAWACFRVVPARWIPADEVNYAALDREFTLARAIRHQRRNSEFRAAAITLNRRFLVKTSPLPGCAAPSAGADPYRSQRLRRKTDPAEVVILEPPRHRTFFDINADDTFEPGDDEEVEGAVDLELHRAISDLEIVEALNWPFLEHDDGPEEDPPESI